MAALFLALTQGPSSGVAQESATITFEPAPLPGGSELIDSWTEQDIQFTTPSKLVINDISNSIYPYNGTSYLQCQYGESPLTIVTVDGRTFSLVAVDLAEYSTVYNVPKAITFSGTHVDGTAVSVTFTTDGIIDGNGSATDFQTFAFPDTFTDLKKVTVDTDRYSMDNLQVTVGSASASPTPTPTPTPTPALLPVITSAATATAQVNQPFAYQIMATHAPDTFTASYLPGGLNVDKSTGLISGTVTTAGTFDIALGATNETGTGGAILTLYVSVVTAPTPGLAPVITSAATATVPVGQTFVYLITATNTPVSFTASGLPDGLTVDPTGGLISGTASTAGMFGITLGATNASGTGTALLTLNVTSTLPSVTVGVVGSGVATEDGAAGKIVFRRQGNTDNALAVRYRVKGSAVAGVDYKPVSGVITIPAGATQAKLKIKPIDNGTADGTCTVKIKLVSSTNDIYTLGAATTAKVTITDND